MRYQIFFIDLDQTLLDFNKSEKIALKNTFSELKIKYSRKIYRVYHEINKTLWKRFEKGEIAREDIFENRFKQLFMQMGEKYNPNAPSLYFSTLANNAHKLPKAERFLKKLKELGKIYILTNGRIFAQKSRIEKSGLQKYFDGVFISEQTQYKKPDRQFFEYAAARVPNFDKNRCLMIGDSLSSDIKGGNNFGIDTVLFAKKPPKASDIVPTFYAKTYKSIIKFIKQS